MSTVLEAFVRLQDVYSRTGHFYRLTAGMTCRPAPAMVKEVVATQLPCRTEGMGQVGPAMAAMLVHMLLLYRQTVTAVQTVAPMEVRSTVAVNPQHNMTQDKMAGKAFVVG